LTSIGDVVAALRQAVNDLPFPQLADAHELAEDAKYLIGLAATGSGQDEFRQVAALLEKAADGIGELQQLLTVIQQVATAAANRLEGERAPAAPVDTNLRSSPAPTPVPPLAKPPLTSTTPESLLGKLPKRTETSTKTHGVWLDSRGQERDSIVSGWDAAQAKATEVLRGLGIGPPRGELWVASHVEVKLAVQLRDTDEKTVTLAVNNKPCDDGRWSCDRLLPRILQVGQRVTVHWPGGMKTYEGKAS
jgi:hypothetical protein